MSNKLTPEEIKKALECCVNGKCFKCPLKTMNCSAKVPMAFALDLINRQQEELEEARIGVKSYKCKYKSAVNTAKKLKTVIAEKQAEIEQWKQEANKYQTLWCEDVQNARAGAIKEFAERLCEGRVSNDPVVIAVKCELKEMVGEQG